MYRMTDEEFEAAIQEALDAMPAQFMEALENVAVVWEDEPNAYHLGLIDDSEEDFEWDGWSEEWDGGSGPWDGEEDESVPWGSDGDGVEGSQDGEIEGPRDTEAVGDADASDDYIPGPNDLLGLFDGLSIVERADGYDDDIPDVITVFKGPHERCFQSREQIVDEIGKTIIHELGHYFGLEDDQLYDMGY